MMSGIIKSAFRMPVLKSAGKFFRPNSLSAVSKYQSSRNVWCMTSSKDFTHRRSYENLLCRCYDCKMGLHTRSDVVMSKAAPEVVDSKQGSTQGEKELADFLVEEITAEKKVQKEQTIPKEIEGFKVILDGSEVSLQKKIGDESIEVNFNINHSVDSETPEPEIEQTMDKPELGEMKARPSFEVEIRRGERTLGFTCTIVTPAQLAQQQQQAEPGEAYNDLFIIDEVVMYEGEWKDSNYSVSAEVIDGTLYDLFMNLLEDKGIGNDFIVKLVDFSTAYEQQHYVKFLQNIHSFVTTK